MATKNPSTGSSKLGGDPARRGSSLYPGFYPTVPPGFGRIQRLEKGLGDDSCCVLELK